MGKALDKATGESAVQILIQNHEALNKIPSKSYLQGGILLLLAIYAAPADAAAAAR